MHKQHGVLGCRILAWVGLNSWQTDPANRPCQTSMEPSRIEKHSQRESSVHTIQAQSHQETGSYLGEERQKRLSWRGTGPADNMLQNLLPARLMLSNKLGTEENCCLLTSVKP